MNASVTNIKWFNQTAPRDFWWYLPSVLTDGKISQTVAPLSCSGEQCSSFFLPGPLSSILFDPTLPNITQLDFSTASTYIQVDAPGYQVEFYAMDETREPPFTLVDCRAYGGSSIAVNVCLRKSGMSLLAGRAFRYEY